MAGVCVCVCVQEIGWQWHFSRSPQLLFSASRTRSRCRRCHCILTSQHPALPAPKQAGFVAGRADAAARIEFWCLVVVERRKKRLESGVRCSCVTRLEPASVERRRVDARLVFYDETATASAPVVCRRSRRRPPLADDCQPVDRGSNLSPCVRVCVCGCVFSCCVFLRERRRKRAAAACIDAPADPTDSTSSSGPTHDHTIPTLSVYHCVSVS